MNVVDSSAWLEYFGDGPNAGDFAPAIEDPDRLAVPSLTLVEVFKRSSQLKDEATALEAVGVMLQGRVVELSASLAIDAARLSLETGLAMADLEPVDEHEERREDERENEHEEVATQLAEALPEDVDQPHERSRLPVRLMKTSSTVARSSRKATASRASPGSAPSSISTTSPSPTLLLRASGVSSTSSLPWSMMATRSATRSASSMLCVVRMIVLLRASERM